MKKILQATGFVVCLFALMAVVSFFVSPQVHAAVNGTYYFITAQAGSDPCENPSVTKFSVPVAISTATTTNLLSAVTGDYITVCKYQFSVVGTSPTVQFEYGTTVSTACDTGAASLSGAMSIPTTTTAISIGAESMTFRTPAGVQLCLVTGGTTPSVQGYITYVQQPY
jgi:hypothetical protein